MRITIRVKPGASRARVGGQHDGALVVAVTARSVDGAATQAALRAVAEAFGVRANAVTLHSGHTARTKLIDLTGDAPTLTARLTELLG